ncbi:MAG: transporter [Methylocella sp.]
MTLLVCVSSISSVETAAATEYGLSNYQLGLVIPMSGYIPPPGVYFWDTFYLYQGSGKLFQGSNTRNPAQVTYNIAANIVITALITDFTLFGGQLGFANTSAYASEKTTTVVPFQDAFGINRHLTDQQSVNSITDTEFTALLGWHAGEQHWSLTVSGFVPTGNYDAARTAETSLNRPSLDIKGAYTFLSLQSGFEVSGAFGVMVNGVNSATNYQSGSEIHFEWALNQHFPFGLAVGVGGYFDQQITNDTGSGDILGSFKGRVASVGPLVSYTIKMGDQQVDLSARWFHEFDVQHRVRGDAIFATMGFPLQSKPPAVFATK